jgi:Flp pilus assembly protein TadG
MAPIRQSAGSGRGERGAALVEFALCLPLLLVIIAGIVDFGFVFQRYEVLTNAAREGARLATLPQYNGDLTLIRGRVREYVSQGLNIPITDMTTVLPDAQIVVTSPDITVTSGPVTYTIQTSVITITFVHNFLLLRPILGLINGNWGTSITLTARSQMRNELQAGGGGS